MFRLRYASLNMMKTGQQSNSAWNKPSARRHPRWCAEQTDARHPTGGDPTT